MMALACWTLRINVSKQTIILPIVLIGYISCISNKSQQKKKKNNNKAPTRAKVFYTYMYNNKKTLNVCRKN